VTTFATPRDLELLDADVGDADLAHLALVLQFLQRPDRFLVRHPRVGAVQLVEVDRLDPQPPQRALAGLAQVLGPPFRLPLAGAGAQEAALGRDHQALGVGVQRLGQQLLADRGAVGVGGVDQVDAELDRAPQHRQRRLVVGRVAPDALAGDPHRAEPESPHLQLAELQRPHRVVADRLDRHPPTG
jgi:hypothetical protein